MNLVWHMQTWINLLECKPMLRHTPMELHYHKSRKMENSTRWHSCQNQCYQQSETMMPMTGRLWESLNHYNTGDIGYKGQKSQLRLSWTIKISFQASIILQHQANNICDGWRALRDLIVYTTIPLGQRTQLQTSLAEEGIITREMRRNQNSTHSLRTKCSQLNNWKYRQWNLVWTGRR